MKSTQTIRLEKIDWIKLKLTAGKSLVTIILISCTQRGIAYLLEIWTIDVKKMFTKF